MNCLEVYGPFVDEHYEVKLALTLILHNFQVIKEATARRFLEEMDKRTHGQERNELLKRKLKDAQVVQYFS